MNAATRAVIESLADQLELAEATMAEIGNMVGYKGKPSTALIAEARKLLEDDALSKPASEDAWLRKSLRLTANIRDATDDESSAAYFDQLEHHLRTRPAREGFVSVPVETLEAMRKDARYVEYGRVAMRFVDRAGDVHPGIDDAETICAEFYEAMSKAVDAAMIEAAKGDTNADV